MRNSDAFSKRGNEHASANSVSQSRPRGGLRGSRISQVLSEARASLKEPTRPFTPASLDERAQNSLDGALNRALDREISRTSSAASTGSGSSSRRGSSVTADIWVNDNFGDQGQDAILTMGSVSMDLGMQNGAFDGDVQSNQGSMPGSSLYGMLASNLRSSVGSDKEDGGSGVFQLGSRGGAGHVDSDENLLDGFNSGGYGSGPGGGYMSGGGYGSAGAASVSGDERTEDDGGPNSSSLNLLLCDIGDATSTLETELGTHGGGNSQTLLHALASLSQPVDGLAKYVRKPAMAPTQSALQDVETQKAALTRTLLCIVRPVNTSTEKKSTHISTDARALACRHLLRLYIAQLQRGGRERAKNGSGRKTKGSSEVSRGLLRVTKAIFEMSSNKSDEKAAKVASDTPGSATVGGSQAMLEGGLQLLLDLLAHAWDTVHAEVTAMDSASVSSSSGTTSHPLSILLEAAIFAGGVVRIYSDGGTNRKRLLHLGAIESLGRGFKIALHAAESVAKNGDVATSLHRHLIEQLGRLVEQLVGALRNFSLDSGGRSRILDVDIMSTVCALLTPFCMHSELILSAARITAKLSLLDTFRSQINAKPQNVRSLVEVVVHEADKCREVMEGDNADAGSTGSGSGTWPQWHTWPLLSRVSFTLGNLTTSNAENRAFIGISCSSIKPLIVLLQACACTLTEIYSQDTSIFSDEDSFERSDATVKILRLLANICMDRTVGSTVAARMDVFEMLNELLVCCNSRSEDPQRVKQHEELLLNVVATCTNVTYYACHKQTASASTENIPKRQQTALIAMSKHLSQCLFNPNSEIVLETARALGNLTRLPTVLSSLTQFRTDEALVLLLSHQDMDVISAVTGTLINLSANPRSRGLLTRESNAVGALVTALRRSSLRNLPTSTLICQAFHNIVSATRSDRDAGEETAEVALHPPGLKETLDELVDLADELEDDKYSSFVQVGRAVQKLLVED
eukprot:GSChrysophyteH1.ASY1.ANO1.1379.1 assembled CDS